MGSILGAILAVETVALVLLFPKFRQRMLQRKEARDRFLQSLQRPSPVPRRPWHQPQSPFLIAPSAPSPPEQNPEDAIAAIKNYMAFDMREDARAIFTEAKKGSAVAQFIVGMALLRIGRKDAKAWLRLSAEQNFAPAQDHLGKKRGDLQPPA